MNVKKNEFIIGLVMIAAILMLIFGIFWLGNSNFFVKGLQVNVKMDNANGIAKEDLVYYRGMKVGSVIDAKVGKDAVILNLKVEDVDQIPVDSKFVIKDLSFIGGKIIEIIPGVSQKYLQKNDTVYASAERGISGVVNQFKDLRPKLDKILNNADTLTGTATIKELQATIKDLHSTINDTKKIINGKLADVLSNVNLIAVENREKISKLINSLNNNSSDLSAFLSRSSSTASTLDSILKGIEKGQGSLGGIVKNDSLYRNLNNTITSIDSLVTDLKNHPSKYINVSVF